MTDREREAAERLRAYIDGLEVYVGTGRAFRPDVRTILAALEAAEAKVAAMEPVVAMLLSEADEHGGCGCRVCRCAEEYRDATQSARHTDTEGADA